ncbi:MAG: alanine--tRNA ligase, partial [Alphaproteobacteria bacterium]|nr:alanine--tRNA ligase [Alphaproteobacteria bacterium]
ANLPSDRIIKIATADNFWAMGDTGPCGPCSEVFYDHGESVAGGPPGSADENGDRFIEIWNLVFMQYEQQADGSRKSLPKPSIDTGLGLERIGAVLQGKHDNYETDLMHYLITQCAKQAKLKDSDPRKRAAQQLSCRVIADHLRASAFLIADGILPSNEGRGYVLRRIMRRAMRHAQMLGTQEPFLWQLVPALKAQMATAYPELEQAVPLITETLRHEETRFRETLSKGLRLLEDEISQLKGKILAGEVAFKLYDTYGFPLDLTQDVLRERGLQVDEAGFDEIMEKQRASARAHWTGSGEASTEEVWFDLSNELGATEFIGYQAEEADAVATALIVNGNSVAEVKAGDEFAMLTNQTPFYAESGGQAGDKGFVTSQTGARATIIDTQKKLGNMHVHIGKMEQGALAVQDNIHLAIDKQRRADMRANHSATHLLHEALRRVLGAHVTQKGSLVEAAYLRFDFSHPQSVTDEQLAAVEYMVNAQIRQNGEVVTRLMSPEQARQIGALALFGEKYGDEVRTLSMGTDEDAQQGTRQNYYSIELCGGTHVKRLGDIGLFKITSETAVASGVRRIEAKTAEAARHYLQQQEDYAKEAARLLKIAPAELPSRIESLIADKKSLERDLAKAKKTLALQGTASGAHSGTEANASTTAAQDIQQIATPQGEVKLLARQLEGIDAKDLRALVDEGKKKLGSGVVAFISIADDKAALAIGVTDDLTEQYNAVDLVKIGAEKLGGKGGGGRPDMAQAGGAHIKGADAALQAIANALADYAATLESKENKANEANKANKKGSK